MATLRRKAAFAVQIIFCAVVLWFAWNSVKGNWAEIKSAALTLRPNWGLIVLGGSIVFAAYLVLIDAWRRLMRDWGSTVDFAPTCRMWFVSVLGRYIPGRIWSVAAIGVLSKRIGASPVAAMGSAMLLTMVNTLVGAAVVMALGGFTFVRMVQESQKLVIAPVVLVALFAIPAMFVLALPYILHPIASWLSRAMRRDLRLPRFRELSILRTAAACCIAWVLYGVAYWIFCAGILGPETIRNGRVDDYIAVYAASYLVGYVAIFTPSGLGVRELTLQNLMVVTGLVTNAPAVLAAWFSRVWLTVLEILPGVILLFSHSGDITAEAEEASESVSSGERARVT